MFGNWEIALPFTGNPKYYSYQGPLPSQNQLQFQNQQHHKMCQGFMAKVKVVGTTQFYSHMKVCNKSKMLHFQKGSQIHKKYPNTPSEQFIKLFATIKANFGLFPETLTKILNFYEFIHTSKCHKAIELQKDSLLANV